MAEQFLTLLFQLRQFFAVGGADRSVAALLQRFFQLAPLTFQAPLTLTQLPSGLGQGVAGTVQLLAQPLEFGFLGRQGLLVDQDGVGQLGGLAIPVERLFRVLGHAQPFFVQKAQVDLGLGQPLLGGAAEPLGGLGVVGRSAHATLVDLADAVLGFGVALFGRRQPEPERRLIGGPIVEHIFATADLAIEAGGLDRAPGRQIGQAAAEFADLAGEQAVHHQQIVGIGGGRRQLVGLDGLLLHAGGHQEGGQPAESRDGELADTAHRWYLWCLCVRGYRPA